MTLPTGLRKWKYCKIRKPRTLSLILAYFRKRIISTQDGDGNWRKDEGGLLDPDHVHSRGISSWINLGSEVT